MAGRRDHPENSDAGRQAKADAEKADAKTASQVKDAVNEETDRGLRGLEVDPTPNENYTVAGVTSGAPTPETDAEAAAKAREATRDVEHRAAGVAEK